MRMSRKVVKARTCVYNIAYHMVWTTKNAQKVIDKNLEKRLKELILEIAKEKEFYIEWIEISNEEKVELLVSSHPKHSISYIAKMLKGISARKLLMEFPELKLSLYKGQLWNSSFFVETVGSISKESSERYIDSQIKG